MFQSQPSYHQVVVIVIYFARQIKAMMERRRARMEVTGEQLGKLKVQLSQKLEFNGGESDLKVRQRCSSKK